VLQSAPHFSVLRDPHVAAIAKQLVPEIDAVLASRDLVRRTG
jgi:hypothetical protein